MRYNELTIFTDVDGTLVEPETFDISGRNLAAIKSFIADGGRLAIATGRAEKWAYPLAEKIGVNFPCVLYNGGVIFDFEKNQRISAQYLPKAAYEYTRKLANIMPWAGIVPVSDSFNPEDEIQMVENIFSGAVPHRTPGWRDNNEPWFKVLFGVPPQRNDEFLAIAKTIPMPGIRIITSIEYFIEMLPQGVSKGSALEKMYAEMDLEREKTVAIGDYYNDLEMIRTAGIGACVEGSPQDLISASKYVTLPCKDGAIADLIEQLKRDYP